MKNVTVTLSEDVAAWLKVRATENGRSVSKWLTELLEAILGGEDEYDLAMERYLSRKPRRQLWRIDKRWIRLRRMIDGLEQELLETNSEKPNPRMCEFLILAEDRRFPRHPGFDILALCRATWKTLFCHSRQGGSTIAMQLVRTVEGRKETTIKRKVTEIMLAVLLSRYIPTYKIPVLYLWSAYYGWNMEGFERACIALRIDPKHSTAIEDAYLIACLKYPQRKISEPAYKEKIQRRAAHIISLAALRRAGGKT